MREMVNFGLSIQAPMLEVIANSIATIRQLHCFLVSVMYLLILLLGSAFYDGIFTRNDSHKECNHL